VKKVLLVSGAAIVVALCGLVLAASVTRIGPDQIGLVLTGEPSAPSILGPGMHPHRPFARIVRLPAGSHRYSGTFRRVTHEGASQAVPFSLEADLGKGQPAALGHLGELVAREDSLDAALEALVGETVDRSAGDDGELPDAGEVALALSGVGVAAGSLVLGAPRVADAADNPLAHAYAGPPWPILVIGLDAADWDLMEPLMASGRMPVLKALRDRGAWARLASMKPTLSPILWTTIATGRPPEEHGIIDFLIKDPATGSNVPISRLFRRVKALWNIASDLSLPNVTVGWWATWPAERVDGVMVTDRVAYSLFDLPLQGSQPGNVYPDSAGQEVAEQEVPDEDVSYEEVSGIVGVSRARYEHARRELQTAEGYEDPVSHLIKVIAATRTYHDIALHLIRSRHPRFSMVYFEGIDEVNHRFAQYLPPAMAMTDKGAPADRHAFEKAVPNFYAYQDRLLGDLIEAAGKDAIVMVVSDHGFANGQERPVDVPPDIDGKPALWHTMEGVLLVAGPPIRPGEIDRPVGLLDVAPTLLALMGLPTADDMPGKAAVEIFQDGAVPAPPAVDVASYDTLGEPLQTGGMGAASPEDQEMIAKLTALGYIQSGDAPVPGAGEVNATYHVNAGYLMLQKHDLDRAAEEFRKARELAPRFDQPYLGLARVAVLRGQPADAIPFLEQSLLVVDAPQPAVLTRIAAVYASAGKEADGLRFFGQLHYEGRREAFRLTALGMLHESQGEDDAALQQYRSALTLDPSVQIALEGVYKLMKGRNLDELAGILEKSQDVDEARVALRAANWLALTRELQGRRPEAREILSRALKRSPDDLMTLTNLGSMLVRDDRADEGLPLLEKAYAIQPNSFEVLVNLIVADAKLGRLAEARKVYAECEPSVQPDQARHLYNAIAFACFLNGATDDARTYIERSLSLDPNQPDAVRLREEIERKGRR